MENQAHVDCPSKSIFRFYFVSTPNYSDRLLSGEWNIKE